MTKSEKYIKEIVSKGYSISKEGKVTNPKGTEVIGSVNSGGYKKFSYRSSDSASYPIRFHIFQAYTKYGDEVFKDTLEVRHLNGNSLENTWDNIALGTHSENLMDIPEIKRKTMASNPTYNHSAIIADRLSGLTYTQLEKKYGANKSSLHYVVNKSLKAQGII